MSLPFGVLGFFVLGLACPVAADVYIPDPDAISELKQQWAALQKATPKGTLYEWTGSVRSGVST